MTLELDIETSVVEKAAARGWVSRKVRWVGQRAAMDRVFFGFGRCVFIEFKKQGRKTKGLQKRKIERLREKYPDIHVCDNEQDALDILEIGRAP